MGKEGSVAPQERVNITYKPATGGASDEVELPLKMRFIGDYTGVAVDLAGNAHAAWTDFRGLPNVTRPNQDTVVGNGF